MARQHHLYLIAANKTRPTSQPFEWNPIQVAMQQKSSIATTELAFTIRSNVMAKSTASIAMMKPQIRVLA